LILFILIEMDLIFDEDPILGRASYLNLSYIY